MAPAGNVQAPHPNLKPKQDRPVSYYHSPNSNSEFQHLKDRRQSGSPPPPPTATSTVSSSSSSSNSSNSSSQFIKPPQMSSFQQQQQPQHPRAGVDAQKRITNLMASPPLPPPPPNLSTVPNSIAYQNYLSPILTKLSLKYRNVSESGQIITVDPNLEHTIDEIRNSFLSLEQQHHGACDSFIKNILNVLNSKNSNSSITTTH
jgi:hypothetical protein